MAVASAVLGQLGRRYKVSVLYFAYGSNLHPLRLTERISTADLQGTGHVLGRRLAFHKKGKDGSGKCDAAQAADSERVIGALYVVDSCQWSTLCGIEGVGSGYEEVTVSVERDDGQVAARTFIAQPDSVDSSLAPFDWYHALVMEGARFHGFPNDYTEQIDAVHSFVDPDSERAANNWSLVEKMRTLEECTIPAPPAADVVR
jgi:hypothetical protein